MESARYRLPPTISFRCLERFAVLLDHASGDILRLNPAAGRVLRAIEAADRELSAPAVEFAEELRRRGHLIREGAPPAAATPAVEPAGPTRASPGVLERLNRDAAADLVPLHCQLEVTYRCLLGCRHCYLPPDFADPEAELTLDEIRSLLDQLATLGGLFLLLTGGEPFVRPDLEQIFNAARDRRFAVSFLTSGAGVHLPMLQRMAARGIDSLQVSLYGADAATHDALTRAPGSFDAALACLRAGRDLGVRVRAGVTLVRSNLGSLGRIKALLEREGVPVSMGLHIEPRRDGSREPQALAIDEAGIRAALEQLPPRDRPRLESRALDDQPCGAGSNVLAVDPYGGVYPCLSLREPAGSLRESSLESIWTGARSLAAVRSLRIADLEGCPTCADRSSCNRCPGLAHSAGLGLVGHATLDCAQARVLACIKERNGSQIG